MADSLKDVLKAAVDDFAAHGFDSQDRLNYWMERIKQAADMGLTPPDVMEALMKEALNAIYTREIESGRILQHHPGVDRFTLARIRPHLRDELDRRIMAATGLIRLNSDQVVPKMLQRFSGWATSIPAGGSDVVDKADDKKKIRKSVAGLPFEERRVLIDQGYKLVSSLSEIIAKDGGAIAGHWHSHFRQPGYRFREEHKHLDVDNNFFVVPDNWALKNGLMKLAGARYITDIERPGEKPFCRCRYLWIYSLRDLPSSMLTAKGRDSLKGIAA